MTLAEPGARAGVVGILPGLTLALANGRAPRSFGLPTAPTAQVERVLIVAELYLSAAQETGDVDLAFLGLQLLRANHLQPHFGFQKQLTNVFAAASRIRTDWQTRASGQLVEAFPHWQEYLKLVKRDNLRAAALYCQLEEGNPKEAKGAETSEEEGKKGGKEKGKEKGMSAVGWSPSPHPEGEGQHEYFTSRRREDLQRLSELEANIEAAVRARLPELSKGSSTRRGRRGEADVASSTSPVRAKERRGGSRNRTARSSSKGDERDDLKEGGVEKEVEGVATPTRARSSPPVPSRMSPPEPSSESFATPLDYEEFRF
ncbi:unnamed protein product, partial [Phytomonas sp. EM1]